MAKHIWSCTLLLICALAVCTLWVSRLFNERVATAIEEQNKAIDRAAMWQRDQLEQQIYLYALENCESTEACWDIFNGTRQMIDRDIGDRPSRFVPSRLREVYTRDPIIYPIDQSEAEAKASGTAARNPGR